MNNFNDDLRPFARRVRFLRAWRGLAVGLCAGACLALIWAALDLAGILFSEWTWLGILVVSLGAFGAVIGFLLAPRHEQIASSLDQRAHLKDRLTSAIELGDGTAFGSAIVNDAGSQLKGLKPSQLYPVRFGVWQAGAFGVSGLAAMLFLLGNSAMLLSPDAKRVKEQLENAAAQIERVAKPLAEGGENVKPGVDEKQLAEKMRRFSRELEKGRLNEKEAMQRANELAQEAENLTKKRVEEIQDQMATAQSKLAEMKLQEQGLKDTKALSQPFSESEKEMLAKLNENQSQEPGKEIELSKEIMDALKMDESMRELAQMSDLERNSMESELQKQLSDIERQLKSTDLTASERKALEEQKNALNELKRKLEISEEARKAIQEIMDSSEYKELQELMSKVQQSAKKIEAGEKLSDEEIKQLAKELEEFAESLKDPAVQEAMKEAMREMIEALKRGELTAEACMQCMGLLGGIPGQGGRSKDDNFSNQDKVNKSEEPMELKGKTTPTSVTGKRDEKRGSESYVEIKAPTTLGTRTSVPYQTVLPKYQKKAESAIDRNKIPREHQKRVREYFKSLGGG